MTTTFSYKFYNKGEDAPNWLFGKGTAEVDRNFSGAPLYNALYHDVYLAVNGTSPVIQSAMKSAVPNTQAILDAMSVWKNYLDIDFSAGAGTKTIAYGGWTSGFGSATTFTGNSTALGSYAILFNSNVRYGIDLAQAQIGNWGGWIQMHELGHVLGLNHPNNKPANATNGSTNESDDMRFTFMYDPKTNGGTIDPTIKIPLTPGMTDINNLQNGLNGAPNYGQSHAQDGTTIYKFTQTGTDINTAAGSITLGYNPTIYNAPIKHVMTLWDRPMTSSDNGGGIDTIDASGVDSSVYISLQAGQFSSIGSGVYTAPSDGIGDVRYNVGIAAGAQIENAKGGIKADLIIGNEWANKLEGNASNDTLKGGAGNDSLYGGADNDELKGEANDDYLDGGAGNDTMDGGDGINSYVWSIGSTDTIIDNGTRGLGNLYIGIDNNPNKLINLNGIFINSQANPNIYTGTLSDGTQITLTQSGANTTITSSKGGTLNLGSNFASGDYGIRLLDDNYKPSPAGEYRNIEGDKQTIDFNSSEAGIQPQLDDLSNVKTNSTDQADKADILNDSAGADSITGGGGKDIINAIRGGNDKIEGGAGDDEIDGGSGNDEIRGGGDRDLISGGTGIDITEGGTEYDVLLGGNDNDRIFANGSTTKLVDIVKNNATQGGSGQQGDWLAGEQGDDLLVGDDGDDVLLGGRDNDVVFGGGGDDLMIGDDEVAEVALNWVVTKQVIPQGTFTELRYTFTHVGQTNSSYMGNDILFGQNGNDWIFAGKGNDYLDGGIGNDQLLGGAGDDTLFGQDGDDSLGGESANSSDTGNDTLHGGNDNDSLFGHNGNDALFGDAGIDYLKGGAGNDYLFGGTEVDTLKGEDGDDTLVGGSDGDWLVGGAGSDTFYAGKGDRIVDAGAQDIVMLGGTATAATAAVSRNEAESTPPKVFSNGTVIYHDSPSAFLDIGGGQSVILGSAIEATGDVTYTFANGSQIKHSDLVGNRLNSIVEIESDAAMIFGGMLNDSLYAIGEHGAHLFGGRGDDLLWASYEFSNSENNTLDGGLGADTMLGGLGNDTYIVDNIGDEVGGYHDATYDIDTVISSITYTLAENIENLTLTGVAALNGTGNTESNVIVGNSAANILNGKEGLDTLTGGAGNDTYIIDDVADIIVETSTLVTEIDTVQSSATYVLSANLEKLILNGAAIINGTGNNLANTITGNVADNILDGGYGIDTLIGGAGNDTYIVSTSADMITEALNAGIDSVQSNADYVLSLNVENLTLTGIASINAMGNALANRLVGNDGDNRLDGLAGIDTMIGGKGNDSYVLSVATDVVTENTNEGNDTVTIAYAVTTATTLMLNVGNLANIENMTVTGTGIYHLTGNDQANVLIGNASANKLLGGLGNDTLNGGAGIDSLIGGDGDDTYIVDTTADAITETLNADIDTVQSTATYTLSANLENLILTGSVAVNGIGNVLNNILTGNSAANILNGDTGADTLLGGLGNDTYVVDTDADVIIEVSSLAIEIDTVQSAVTYTLGDNLERLTLTGVASTNGMGNTLNNILTGNVAGNTLDGGLGIDTMIGGTGNDVYMADSTADLITEVSAIVTEIDTVIASATYTLAANLEILTLVGSANINATGNAIANKLIGNSANNSLNGVAGNDTLDGGLGVDTLTGGLGDDTYIIDDNDLISGETGGIDTLKTSLVNYSLATNTLAGGVVAIDNLVYTGTTNFSGTGNILANMIIGGAGSDVLTGNAGNDTLDGGAGSDTMLGGIGDDTYYVDDIGDVITELVSAGKDTVVINRSYTLGIDFENLILNTSENLNATGNTSANTLTGNSGNNILDGGLGIDTMVGGNGDDTYVIDNILDVVTETSALQTEIDSVRSSITYALGINLENLTLTDAANINATGNALANFIIGNNGNNVISGLAGSDTLLGGLGDDTYTIDTLADTIIENINAGIDLVNVAITTANGTYTLADNIENAAVTNATVAYNLTGNMLNNLLLGNALANKLIGNDTLDGAAGIDTMMGGLGNDTYVLSVNTDVVTESLNEGIDTVNVAYAVTAATTLTLGMGNLSNIENLMITGTGIYNLVGSDANNSLTGNASANSINGGAGADTLYGGLGNDTLDGGLSTDTFVFDTTLSATNIDKIMAFNSADDTIQLANSLFTQLSSGTLNAANFVVGTAAVDANDYIIYNSGTGDLYYDKDGVGGTAAVKFAVLDTHPVLIADDFVIA